ncbi:c-type cytochrome [Arcobacter sp.]|uniref:c-type cytochrome n=1 Tax=Arcobacter sp. TaxID=1872629 RepID=UPI003D1503CF
MIKLISAFTFTALTTMSLFAQTTMCFKENHKSMSTIEKTKLDGGLCSGEKSPSKMKEEGWNVNDIKITETKNGYNYIYVFKKNENVSNFDIDKLEKQIIARLEDKDKEAKRQAIVKRNYAMSISGKQRYIAKCQRCHGEKGEIESSGTSRPIKDLSLDDFIMTMRDYNLGTYNRGQAFVMMPFATISSTDDIKNIYVYLQSINKEETDK